MSQSPAFYIELYERMKRSQSPWISAALIIWTRGVTVPVGFIDLGVIMDDLGERLPHAENLEDFGTTASVDDIDPYELTNEQLASFKTRTDIQLRTSGYTLSDYPNQLRILSVDRISIFLSEFPLPNPS